MNTTPFRHTKHSEASFHFTSLLPRAGEGQDEGADLKTTVRWQ